MPWTLYHSGVTGIDIKSPTYGGFSQLKQKKDGVAIVDWPHLIIRIISFWKNL